MNQIGWIYGGSIKQSLCHRQPVSKLLIQVASPHFFFSWIAQKEHFQNINSR